MAATVKVEVLQLRLLDRQLPRPSGEGSGPEPPLTRAGYRAEPIVEHLPHRDLAAPARLLAFEGPSAGRRECESQERSQLVTYYDSAGNPYKCMVVASSPRTSAAVALRPEIAPVRVAAPPRTMT
jgi:hypothetical protein